MKIKALEYAEVDQLYHLHLQAYLNMAAQAEKKSGSKIKKVFDTFQKFFDYDEALEGLSGEKRTKKKSILDRVSEFMKNKEEKRKGELDEHKEVHIWQKA